MSYQLIVFDGQLDRLPDLRLAFPRYGACSEIWKLGAEMKRLDPGPNLRVARDLSACLATTLQDFFLCYSVPGVKSTPLEKQTRALLLQAKEDPVNRHISLRALLIIVLLPATVTAAQTPSRVTILYDSFGKNPALTMDWGFAALVEYGGKRILFDTGNNARIFEQNVKALGVHLENIDFVVISHRHADHTSGLSYLLSVNPKVRIYVPDEPWGMFARGVTKDFYRKDPSLPSEMRYYGGYPPQILEAGTPWPGANFIPVGERTEVTPGIFIFAGVSTSPGTLELRELSLAIKSPQGLILIVGCSHPGIEHILQEATAIDPHINILFGGLHQIQKPDPEVARIAGVLHEQYKLEHVAPGHCTGEPEFAALKRAFGDHYVYAGLGSVIELQRMLVSSEKSETRAGNHKQKI